MLGHTASLHLLLVLLLPPLVVSFTFPGDWHKIRQMMEARREAEAEVLSQSESFIIYSELFLIE